MVDNIDVYFIDIEYGDVSGLDVARALERIRPNNGIVYVTSHEQYASSSYVCRPLGVVRKLCIENDIDMMDKSIEIRDKLTRMEKELCRNGFVKTSRSCIVNMKYIAGVKDSNVVMSNGEKIHISEDRKVEVFYEWKKYKMKC